MSLQRIRDHRVLLALLAIVLALIATHAWGAVVYKLTDRAGRVTYVDALPRSFDGSVESLDVDTSRSVTLAPAQSENAAVARAMRRYEEIVAERTAPQDAREARFRQARARVAAARGALLAAQERSTAGDWTYFGAGRGRAPRPEYEARLEALESNLRRAEADLEAAQRG